jgi:hypothetical protein
MLRLQDMPRQAACLSKETICFFITVHLRQEKIPPQLRNCYKAGAILEAIQRLEEAGRIRVGIPRGFLPAVKLSEVICLHCFPLLSLIACGRPLMALEESRLLYLINFILKLEGKVFGAFFVLTSEPHSQAVVDTSVSFASQFKESVGSRPGSLFQSTLSISALCVCVCVWGGGGVCMWRAASHGVLMNVQCW